MSVNQVGYKLKNIETGDVVEQWGGIWGQCPGVPNPIMVPTEDPDQFIHVHAPNINEEYFGYILEEWTMEPPPAPIPDISRRQFFQQAAIENLITQQEAIDALKTGAIPVSLQQIIDGITNTNEKFVATMLIVGATTFSRTHQLTETIGIAMGLTVEEIDNFFRAASIL